VLPASYAAPAPAVDGAALYAERLAACEAPHTPELSVTCGVEVPMSDLTGLDPDATVNISTLEWRRVDGRYCKKTGQRSVLETLVETSSVPRFVEGEAVRCKWTLGHFST